jgi:transposase
MRKKPKYLEPEDKLAAVARMACGENVTLLAEELGVVRRLLYQWRAAYRRRGRDAFQGPGRPPKEVQQTRSTARPAPELSPPQPATEASGWEAARAAQGEIEALQRKIGEQQMELDFFRRALRQVKGAPQASAAPGGATSTRSSKS